MNAVAWITGMFIVAFVGYVAGRLVAAIQYNPIIDRLARRQVELDWEQNNNRLAECQLHERKKATRH
jgi:hypothetical protein